MARILKEQGYIEGFDVRPAEGAAATGSTSGSSTLTTARP